MGWIWRMVLGIGAVLVAAAPLSAQNLSVAGGLFAQTQPGIAPTRWGPSALLAAEFGSGPAPIRAELSVARTHFTVDGEDFHTNLASALVGLASRRDKDKTTVGLFVGVGARVIDDVADSDANFLSSARWQSLVAPGFNIARKLGQRAEVAVLLRYYISGVLGSIIDSQERDVRNAFGLLVGLSR